MASPAGGDPGHDHSRHAAETARGRPGDPAKPGRAVRAVVRETDDGVTFSPSRVEAARGEQVRFVLRNTREFDRELVVGAREANLRHAGETAGHLPGVTHEDPNAERLRPKAAWVLRWHFIGAGEFEHAGPIPGHRRPGSSARRLCGEPPLKDSLGTAMSPAH